MSSGLTEVTRGAGKPRPLILFSLSSFANGLDDGNDAMDEVVPVPELVVMMAGDSNDLDDVLRSVGASLGILSGKRSLS